MNNPRIIQITVLHIFLGHAGNTFTFAVTFLTSRSSKFAKNYFPFHMQQMITKRSQSIYTFELMDSVTHLVRALFHNIKYTFL